MLQSNEILIGSPEHLPATSGNVWKVAVFLDFLLIW
jgi:hypothetical protein